MVSTTHAAPSGRIRETAVLFLALIVVAGVASAQDITVQDGSTAPVRISAAEIAAMPHQSATVENHGRKITYGGVPLRLLLEKGGITLGESIHGKRLASYLLVQAADGYRVVFALPELDPGFTDRVILLADRADGHPLNSKAGPYQVVVPGEKRMARSARQVTTLKILTAP